MRLERLDDSALRHVDNIYYRGAHYDQRYATYTHDVEFWCDLARSTAGPVLELAAGTGRLSLPIAAGGLDVVGLDVSPSMIDQALRKRGTATTPTFLVGDMRNFELDRQFALVMLACSSICHLLTDEDALSCLDTVAAHLRPDGVFAIDVATPQHETARADGQSKDRFSYADPLTGQQVAVRGRRTYTAATGILIDEMEYKFIAQGRVEAATRLSRMYSVNAMVDLLARAGLKVDAMLGGFDGRPLTADSETQILICSLDSA